MSGLDAGWLAITNYRRSKGDERGAQRAYVAAQAVGWWDRRWDEDEEYAPGQLLRELEETDKQVEELQQENARLEDELLKEIEKGKKLVADKKSDRQQREEAIHGFAEGLLSLANSINSWARKAERVGVFKHLMDGDPVAATAAILSFDDGERDQLATSAKALLTLLDEFHGAHGGIAVSKRVYIDGVTEKMVVASPTLRDQYSV